MSHEERPASNETVTSYRGDIPGAVSYERWSDSAASRRVAQPSVPERSSDQGPEEPVGEKDGMSQSFVEARPEVNGSRKAVSETPRPVASFPDSSRTEGVPPTWRGEGMLRLVGNAAALAAYRRRHPEPAIPERYRRFLT